MRTFYTWEDGYCWEDIEEEIIEERLAETCPACGQEYRECVCSVGLSGETDPFDPFEPADD